MYFLKPAEGLSFLRVVYPEPALSPLQLHRLQTPPPPHRGAITGPAGWLRAGGAWVDTPRRFQLCPLWPRQPSVLGVLAGMWAIGSAAPPRVPPLPEAAPQQDSSLAAFFSLPLAHSPVTRCRFSPKQMCPGAPRPQVKSDKTCSLTGPSQPRRWKCSRSK